jgi:hypothetical protein
MDDSGLHRTTAQTGLDPGVAILYWGCVYNSPSFPFFIVPERGPRVYTLT